MDPLFKNLKKQVTCSICLDTYTEPKTISCLHTFCCECLERHARVSQRQGKFRCPECQAEIDLPHGNRFDRLPNSFFHKSLLGVLEAEDCQAIPRQQQETCSQHTEERLRYYCSTCEASVCPVCVTEDHRGHAFDLLEKAVQEEKKNIMSTVETIKEKADLFRAELRKLEKTSEDVEMIIAIAKQEVSEATEHVITKTRQQEKQLLESLEVMRRKRLERVNSAKQELESLVKQMNQAVELGENLVQRSTVDIIQDKKKSRQKLEELRGVEVPKHRQATFVKFIAASQHNFKLGSIQVSEKPEITVKSTLEGGDQTFQVGAEAKFNGDKLPTCPITVQVKERKPVVVSELKLRLFPGDTLERLNGIAVNTEGQLVVTDNSGHCVYVFDKNGDCLRKTGGKGSNTGEFQYPNGISFLNDNEVLIADSGNYRLQRLNIQTGTVVKSYGKKGRKKGEFSWPIDVTVDDEERIVVTERDNNRIQVMSKEGESIFTFGDKGPEKFLWPTCCIPYKNMFLVTDAGHHRIKAFDQSGTFLYKFGKEGYQDGKFQTLYDLLVDSSNILLVCDFGNNQVQQFSLDGRFTGKSITRLSKPVEITKAP